MPHNKTIIQPSGSRNGRHCLLDLYGCPQQQLDSIESLDRVLRNAAEAAGAHVLGVVSHRFEPQGISLVYLLAESHLSIHTWPEHHSATLDIYTCGESCNPSDACHYIIQHMQPAQYFLTEVQRGAPASPAHMRLNSVSCYDTIPSAPQAGGEPLSAQAVNAWPTHWR